MSIHQKGKTWYVVIYYRDNWGRKKQKWHRSGPVADDKSGKKAIQLEHELLTDLARGQIVVDTRLTVKDFLAKWLEVEIKPALRPRTIYLYTAQINNICKKIGQIELRSLTPLQIKEHMNSELTRGLSSSSLGTQIAILKRAMKKAKEWHLVIDNPCEYLRLPKRSEPKNAVYSPQQVEILLKAAKSTVLYLPCLLGFLCGLRRGEICGLRWQDVALEREIANICHNFDRNPLTKKAELGLVKTPASKSEISLPKIVVNALKSEQDAQNQNKRQLGQHYNDLGFIWAKPDGSPHLPDFLYTEFIKLIKTTKLPVIRPHDMRHTFATLLWESGLDDKSVSAATRHANASFTSDYYVHLRQSVKHRPAEAIDSLFKEQLEKD
ncbi:MAG: phage integrase family protein [Firmicutes bacterium]|nr:phage integrase family protein [Bacillota bacterium]